MRVKPAHDNIHSNLEEVKLLVSTTNEGKKREIRSLLTALSIDILTLSDFRDAPEVVEDAPTLEGNARKKACEIHEFTGLATISDDTGLEVDALDGRPGVFSARYAGADGDASANRALLLKELKDVNNRSARFRTVIAFTDGSEVHYFEGVCEGQILREARGTGGFGYDPLFLPDGEALTFAEMDTGRKNLISHRGKALKKFRAFLENYLKR